MLSSSVLRPRRAEFPARATLVFVWVGLAVVFGAMLVVARAAEGPLDDPDPALQRPGFLDVGALPQPAPPVTEDVPRAGRPAVVFFTRPDRLPGLCHALSGHRLEEQADVVVVVAGNGGKCATGGATVTDESGRLAGRYGLRHPNDAGAPIGYAVVDEQRQIRYRTLDPAVQDELDEVETILKAAT